MRDPPPGLRRPTPPAARASWTAGFARLASVSAGVALFLTLSGAFGMEPVPLWKRLAYWLGLLLFGSALSVSTQDWLKQKAGRSVVPRATALAAALAVLMTPVVFVATRLAFGGRWSWEALAGFVVPVSVVCAAMTVLNVLTMRARGAAPAGSTAPPPDSAAGPCQTSPEPSVFMRRLPPKLRGARLYAVEAEDHYLRVHTDEGSDLLLLRLADALDELGPVEGARTHRSWWVARAAVADARRADGRATLVLLNGTEAPVSRSYAAALRQAGWF